MEDERQDVLHLWLNSLQVGDCWVMEPVLGWAQ